MRICPFYVALGVRDWLRRMIVELLRFYIIVCVIITNIIKSAGELSLKSHSNHTSIADDLALHV